MSSRIGNDELYFDDLPSIPCLKIACIIYTFLKCLIDANVRRLLDLTELVGQHHRIAEKRFSIAPDLLNLLCSSTKQHIRTESNEASRCSNFGAVAEILRVAE